MWDSQFNKVVLPRREGGTLESWKPSVGLNEAKAGATG